MNSSGFAANIGISVKSVHGLCTVAFNDFVDVDVDTDVDPSSNRVS